MNANRLFWGVIIIIIGLLWLSTNLGIISGGFWSEIWRLWPIIFVIWGVSLLFSQKGLNTVWLSVISLILVLAIVSAFAWVYKGVKNESIITEVNEQISNSADNVVLDFKIGAAEFILSDGAEKILEGRVESNSGIDIDNEIINKTQTISINQLPISNFLLNPNIKNRMELKTSAELPLRVNIDSGASKITMDLRQSILSELDIDSGATSAEIKIGDKSKAVKIVISSGASTFDIEVPLSHAIKVENKSGLSSNNFSAIGLSKSGENWLSSDYDQNENKIDIIFESGASSLILNRN